jgi:uncharacterized protein (DUF362 family)
MNRREFMAHAFWTAASLVGIKLLAGCGFHGHPPAETYIAKAGSYDLDIASIIRSGFQALHITNAEIKGKRILLKPNLVDPQRRTNHINTHPLVVRGAIEAFLSLGAAEVVVAEGPALHLDTILVLEESGLIDVLHTDHIPFIDLNYDDWYTTTNTGKATRLKTLALPLTLKKVDWIVSMPKMKTHHWAGVTLSMKNLFGVMPGMFYGWPKNVLHREGIEQSIRDVYATVRPHFAIVDGIIGMEGDGPIMGAPKPAGVLVMGRNLPAVDATACRIMGINPGRVQYLADSEQFGPIRNSQILQRGETILSVRKPFMLLDKIEAQKRIKD